MRAFLPLCLLASSAFPLAAGAAQKKPKAAVPAAVAAPAVPAKSATAGEAPKRGALIDSDMDGRDLTFLSSAIELGKTFRYLASQTPRAANPALRSFGEDLVQTLSAQGAVLNTVAEMRRMRIPETQGEAQRQLAAKFEKLDGVKLEKALLDSFREADAQAIAIYEMGAKSDDPTIRKLSEQTLPQFREHLVVVQTMTGIAPRRAPGEIVGAKSSVPLVNEPLALEKLPPVAAPPPRPSFRANVRPPAELAPE